MRFNIILSYLISLFCIIFVMPLQAYDYQPILEFEANLTQSGSLINGNKDVTVKIYKNNTDEANLVYEEEFTNATFIDGNVSLPIGSITPIDPAWFNASINYLSLSVDDDEVITTMSVVPAATFANQSESTPTGDLFPAISIATNNIVVVNSTADGFTYISTTNLLQNLNLSTFSGSDGTSAGSNGLVIAPDADDNLKFLKGDGTWAVPDGTTYSEFSGADGTEDGTNGLVIAPAADDNLKFLRGDGTWAVPTPPESISLLSIKSSSSISNIINDDNEPNENYKRFMAIGAEQNFDITFNKLLAGAYKCWQFFDVSDLLDGVLDDDWCGYYTKPDFSADSTSPSERELIIIGDPTNQMYQTTISRPGDSPVSVWYSYRDTVSIFGESTFIDSLHKIENKSFEFDVNAYIINLGESGKTTSISMSADDIMHNGINVAFNTGNQDYFAQNNLSESPYSISFRHAAEDGESSVGAVEISLLNKSISNTDNFLGFTTETGETIGSITGQQADVFGIAQSGVKLESSGADYAEYLPKRNPKESIQPGDVVGVYNGKISKSTTNADRVMVVSTMPLVIGNKRPDMDLDTHLAIAFVGQVPVYVSGTVNTGDYIIASGKEDGTAIAVHPDTITASQLSGLIGKAWDSTTNSNTNLINVAITPLDIPASLLQSIETRQDKLEADNQELRKMIETIQQQLSSY